MFTLVITGSIGSGKTQVCAHLERQGYPVYYCDDRAKSLYSEVPGLLDRVAEALGTAVTLPDGSLDKARLAGIIFSDEQALKKVESLVHPLVYEDFLKWRDTRKDGVVVMESAIFLQKPLFHPLADYVINVVAPPEQIIRRVMARDRCDRETAERRFISQETASEMLPDATVVNDRDLGTLFSRVDEAIHEMKTKHHQDMKTDLTQILTVSGHHGLYKYVAQARNGIIVESLSDSQRTTLDSHSRVNALSDIAIYTSEGELKLQEVFSKLTEALSGAQAPTSKDAPDTLKALFAKAVPNYDEDRFYVSHMKKVVDWYGELAKYASLDFMTDEDREAEAKKAEEEAE